MARKPHLTIPRILRWADAHRRRTGRWPTRADGLVLGAQDESTWLGIDDALKRGARGLAGGSSLAILLAERRGKRHLHQQPPLTVDTILAWADAHHRRTGRWPNMLSGRVHGTRNERWAPIDAALRYGRRGLRGGSSLPILLGQFGRRRYQKKGGPLSEHRIIQWARAHHQRTGQWPRKTSGPVKELPGDTWRNINAALHRGHRGLPGGTSLLKLLAERCGMRHSKLPPRLSIQIVLRWADDHRRRTAKWPTSDAGPVRGAPGETWLAIDHALRRGTRGLPKKSSLAILLEQRRGRRHVFHQPPLTVDRILAWADRHHETTGRWPHSGSGPVAGEPGEVWNNIDAALHFGRRGLPGGDNLRRLITRHKHRYDRFDPPPLTIEQILTWADAHYLRRGTWPKRLSGPIPESPPETWNTVYRALRRGRRGLRGHTTIARLLAKHGRKRHLHRPPKLSIKQILAWADAHYQRMGEWPSRESGPIPESPGEKWSLVAAALERGARGLRGRQTLVKLLSTKRRDLYRRRGIPLKRSKILEWMAAHHEQTGDRPHRHSGPVRDQPGETWAAIDAALAAGTRGLPGGESLHELVKRHYVPPYPHCGRRLTESRIIQWAESFKQRVGAWPTLRSAHVDPSRTERWSVIDKALREGLRGLRGGSSLAKLLRTHARTRSARRSSAR